MGRRAVPLALVLSLSGLACASAPAAAQTTAPASVSVEARLREVLAGFEDAPARQEILALGDEGLAALIRIHDDARTLGAIRLRAITCASWIPGERARSFLLRVLRAPGQDPMHLRTAIRAYAAREGASAVDEIVRHATHDDVAVREAVLLSLVSLRDGDAVDRTLERLLAAERDAELVRSVRTRMQR
ncbi:MAG: hypothetical protein OHK0013_22260 [Sandaracinaceae bacterium]